MPFSRAMSQQEAAACVRKPQSFGEKGSTNQLPLSLVTPPALVRGGRNEDVHHLSIFSFSHSWPDLSSRHTITKSEEGNVLSSRARIYQESEG